jgi:hypothetical protein
VLNLEPNLDSPDDIYEHLIATHCDLSPEQSEAVNARLILLLMNHIGDATVLRQALRRARQGIVPQGQDVDTSTRR